MKKLFIIMLLLTLVICFTKSSNAYSDYNAFEEIRVEDDCRLLKDYSIEEMGKLKEYFQSNPRIFGWKIGFFNSSKEVKFRAETILSMYNDSKTTIDYDMELKEKFTRKRCLSATGSIGIETNGGNKTFKSGLDSSLKVSYEEEDSQTEEMTQNLKFQVEPGTQASLYIDGNALLTNGYAARYRLFVMFEYGGFEVFQIGGSYYRLEKTRIRE